MKRRSDKEEGEQSDNFEEEDWETKYHEVAAQLKAAESPAKQNLTTASPNRNNTSISTDSTSGQGANTIVNVNTHTDQRIFQVMTAKRMNSRGFEEMIPILQAGQKLSHYCDRDAEELIYVHLDTMSQKDPSFTTTKRQSFSRYFYSNENIL